ncbi:MAG TPA: Fe(3+) ABC transporter substrate-binding protein [Flavobacteriales bacterium]|nr:Fe(3+) ABC transporter substrate-binding protein [Flavobacteriales bacterium]
MRKILTVVLMTLAGCMMSEDEKPVGKDKKHEEVNVYTHRHYAVDRKIFRQFFRETGIYVNVIDDDADKLMVRLEKEGKNSPCDVFMTVDAGRLVRAKEKGLLQPIDDDKILNMVPANLRDDQGYWLAQTVRARVIVYSRERVRPNQLSTYEDLADAKWKGKLTVRSSDNIYNQSLLASLIAHNGSDAAGDWAAGIVSNLAVEPRGNDKDQVKAIAAGEADVSFVNTYYLGQMIESADAGERDAVSKIGVFFPNQEGRGAHINISGAGIARYAPHKTNAQKLIEFMLRDDIQEMFAEANNEFPARKGVSVKPVLKEWLNFKTDTLSLQKLGELNRETLILFNAANWK